MTLGELTDPAAVRQAIAECDEKGREAFRQEYGFGPSDRYVLTHPDANGIVREYDSKAIVAVAHRYQHGTALEVFSGGRQSVVPVLERLGFRVVDLKSEWTEDELVLALHWALGHPTKVLRPTDPETRALVDILRSLAGAQGRTKLARYRDAATTSRQLATFRALAGEGKSKGKGPEVTPRHRQVWATYAHDDYARKHRVHLLLNWLEGVNPSSAPAGAPLPSYRRRRKSSADELGARADAANLPVLVKPYAGPKVISKRALAELRRDDPEKYDRSNAAHESVRMAIALALEAREFELEDPATKGVDFDLGARKAALRLVIEAKSLPPDDATAEAARLRAGLGQVLWYRHRFWTRGHERRVAVLAVERQPRDTADWVSACAAVGVVLTWPEAFGGLVQACWQHAARAEVWAPD